MTNSVWPYDTYVEPDVPIHTEGIDEVNCFVALPSNPKERWDELYALIQDAWTEVRQRFGVPGDCIRAIDIVSSGVIHPEIWKGIKGAHIVICDVTGNNGNVILELGVAASWRRKENVIILRERNDEKEHLFDIMPARHLEYELSYHGIPKLMTDLRKVMVDILGTYPFHEPSIPPVVLPFEADLQDGRDVRELYTEDITNRRMISDSLEFGSPLVYRHSWMTVGNLRIQNVRVQADLKMTYLAPNTDHFMGIMVRGLSYFSNYGHFAIVRPNGRVSLAGRGMDGNLWEVPLDSIPDYDVGQFTHFDVSIDDKSISISVNGYGAIKKVSELPYLFTNGRIIFIAGWCLVGLRKVKVEPL